MCKLCENVGLFLFHLKKKKDTTMLFVVVLPAWRSVVSGKKWKSIYHLSCGGDLKNQWKKWWGFFHLFKKKKKRCMKQSQSFRFCPPLSQSKLHKLLDICKTIHFSFFMLYSLYFMRFCCKNALSKHAVGTCSWHIIYSARWTKPTENKLGTTRVNVLVTSIYFLHGFWN